MTGIFGDDKLYTANRHAPLAFGQVGASLGQRSHSALAARSMQHTSLVQRAGKWLVVVSLLAFGFAMAQPEPSLNQVYATAQAGKLDEAQTMIQQVLISHPKSSKAHFVRAELFCAPGQPEAGPGSAGHGRKAVSRIGLCQAGRGTGFACTTRGEEYAEVRQHRSGQLCDSGQHGFLFFMDTATAVGRWCDGCWLLHLSP